MTPKLFVTAIVAFFITVVGSGCLVGGAEEKSGLPDGWLKAGKSPSDYDMRIDDKVYHDGKYSGLIKSKIDMPSGFGTLMQMCRADKFLGERVRMTGYIKVEGDVVWKVNMESSHPISFLKVINNI